MLLFKCHPVVRDFLDCFSHIYSGLYFNSAYERKLDEGTLASS